MRERQEANRTREAGHLDEIQGVVANTLRLFRNGAVGFIVWLGDFLALVIVRLRAKPVALAVFAGPNSELVLFCVMSRAFYLRKEVI